MSDNGTEAFGPVDVADRIAQASHGGRVSVGKFIAAIGQRAFGPLLLVFGLIALSPICTIPGASIVTGLLIILIAIQMLIGRQTPWFPGRLTRISVESEAARSAVGRVKPYLVEADKLISRRWQELLKPLSVKLAAFVCLILAATMFPLAVVPGGAAVPALAIIVLSLGISSHDGVVLSIGLALGITALGVFVYLIL